MKNQAEMYIRRVFGVSERFVTDFVGVVGCLQGDANEYLADGLVSTHILHFYFIFFFVRLFNGRKQLRILL